MKPEDERLIELEKEKENQLQDTNQQLDGLLNDRQDLMNQQNQLVDRWEQTQNDAMDKQMQFQQDLINQQKAEAQKNYESEAKSAYTDYRKENNNYGVSREQQAQSGLSNSGYSESSRVGMFNAYQNRLGMARKSMDKAYLEFSNALKEAQMTNDINKAQNAYKALENKLNISLEGFKYKESIIKDKINAQNQAEDRYYNRYQNTLNQINYEKEQEEARRRYEEEINYRKAQDKLAKQQWEREMALRSQRTSSSAGGSKGNGTLTDGSALTDNKPSGMKSANGINIIKNPYTGTINPDTQYGVHNFNESGNGYMPDNIGGKKLSRSGKTVSQILGTTGNTGASGINIDKQNVWELNNRYYVWDGSQDKYVDITNEARGNHDYYKDKINSRGSGRF